jgi:hypothetical protein
VSGSDFSTIRGRCWCWINAEEGGERPGGRPGGQLMAVTALRPGMDCRAARLGCQKTTATPNRCCFERLYQKWSRIKGPI